MKTFKIINGKWNISNIFDALHVSKFDHFIKTFREIEKKVVRQKKDLKKYNYKFKLLIYEQV